MRRFVPQVKPWDRMLIVAALALCVAPALLRAQEALAPQPPTPELCRAIAHAADVQLRRDVLPYWFPRCIDKERGGYHQRFTRDWSATDYKTKTLVHQARLAWVCAAVGAYDEEMAGEFRGYALHGLKFLNGPLRDRQSGGMYWEVDPAGRITPEIDTEKHVYSIVFGILAGASLYEATREEAALDLAVETYKWLDRNAHDDVNGGYFEALTREGKPILEPYEKGGRLATTDRNGVPYGQKTMNAHMHVLESFTALYRAWPDEHLKERLGEVLAIVRDKITAEAGYMGYYYTLDWQMLPNVPSFDSFGHDVETAWLMLKADDALGMPDDEVTLATARKVVDFALEHGWDEEFGGFASKKDPTTPQANMAKVLWAQAEGLNVLLAMHERFGKETDRYWRAFVKEWEFVRDHAVDKEFGGWCTNVSREGAAAPTEKSEIWHCTRALIHVSRTLGRMADEAEKAAPADKGATPAEGAHGRAPVRPRIAQRQPPRRQAAKAPRTARETEEGRAAVTGRPSGGLAFAVRRTRSPVATPPRLHSRARCPRSLP